MFAWFDLWLNADPSATFSTASLRLQLAGGAIAVILLFLGFAALAAFFLRHQSRDRSMAFFSLFSILYSARLLFRQEIVRAILPFTPVFWGHAEVLLDSFVAIPLGLFFIELVDENWKRGLRWLLVVQTAFGVVRVACDFLSIGRGILATANSFLTLFLCGLLAVYYLQSRSSWKGQRDFSIVFAGLLTFAAFVVRDNLVDLGFLSGSKHFEPIGFFLFACCMGYVAAGRTFGNEERLITIQKELDIAQQIQSSILPRETPKIAGLEVAARYLPMGAVAGDFYDFVAVTEDSVGILVADVTGHGVPAALIASMLKVALGAQSVHAAEPARVLDGLNKALCGRFEAHFITAAFLFVDLRNRRLRYAAAGHPPLFLSKRGVEAIHPATDTVEEIEENGLPLGMLEEAQYTTRELSLGSGSRCLLYTDGVLEAKNSSDEEFGRERCRQVLADGRALSANALADSLLQHLARWTARSAVRTQEDDITLLVLDFAL